MSVCSFQVQVMSNKSIRRTWLIPIYFCEQILSVPISFAMHSFKSFRFFFIESCATCERGWKLNTSKLTHSTCFKWKSDVQNKTRTFSPVKLYNWSTLETEYLKPINKCVSFTISDALSTSDDCVTTHNTWLSPMLNIFIHRPLHAYSYLIRFDRF